jgi:hypothetical protein
MNDLKAIRLGTGIKLVATTSGAVASLATLSDGATNPRYVRVLATTNAYIHFQKDASAANATTGGADALLATNFPEIFITGGNACVSAKTETGNATVSIVSLET